MKNRIIGIDILRILSAFVVFLFHSQIHIKCNYGVLDGFIRMGAVFMTTFFILSGFSLFITYDQKNLTELVNAKKFYIKRIISIIPLYYTVSILYAVFLGSESLKDNILLAPVQILGLQTSYTSLFTISHNSGTWFISCILCCYLLYPFFQEMVKQMVFKEKIIVASILVFSVLYSPIIVKAFNLSSIYSNPIFRCMEFAIGVILASAMEDLKKIRWLFSSKSFFVELILLVLGISLGVDLSVEIGNYMYYGWIVLPLSALMILSVSAIRIKNNTIKKIIIYLNSISYAFFLAQFFTWKKAYELIISSGRFETIYRFLISITLCLFITIILHEIIEKPIQKQLKKLLLKER